MHNGLTYSISQLRALGLHHVMNKQRGWEIPEGVEFARNLPAFSPEVFIKGLLCTECKVRDF